MRFAVCQADSDLQVTRFEASVKLGALADLTLDGALRGSSAVLSRRRVYGLVLHVGKKDATSL